MACLARVIRRTFVELLREFLFIIVTIFNVLFPAKQGRFSFRAFTIGQVGMTVTFHNKFILFRGVLPRTVIVIMYVGEVHGDAIVFF